MDKAKDHQGMTGAEFQKDKHPSRPSSVLSNNSSKNQDVRIWALYLWTYIQWLSEQMECGNLPVGKPAVALWIPMTQTWLIPHLKVLNVGFNLRYQTLQKL